MSNFKFQKTVLVVSALAGMLFNTQAFAQVKTEQGSIDITAKIITSTCVLNLDTTASSAQNAAKKTLDLGTFTAANVSSVAGGSPVGKSIPVVLSLKETGGGACNALAGGKWDVLIDLPTTAYNTATSTLNNTTTGTNASTGTVGQGGRALVRINKTQDQLSVTWGNAPDEKCLVDFVLDAKNKANSKGYTNLKLACVVGTAVDKTAQK